MTGFPPELRPLLAIVIVLGIAHMLLKGKARSAQARRARGTRRAGSTVRRASLSQMSHEATSAATPTSAQPIEELPSRLPLSHDPAEALAALRDSITSPHGLSNESSRAASVDSPHARHAHPD